MDKPTTQAAAGKFQSRGEDFVQYVNMNGEIVFWVDSEGEVHSKTPQIVASDSGTF